MYADRAPYLIETIGDPKRRMSEQKIRFHSDVIIYTEGINDAEILASISPSRHFKFVPPPPAERYTGKKGIIRLLSENPNLGYGLVDMDYDFPGNQLKNSDRVTDTREKSCLISFLIPEDLYPEMVKSICKGIYLKEMKKRRELERKVLSNWDLLYEIAMNRTSARLFRGKYGKKMKIGKKTKIPHYSILASEKRKQVIDLIPNFAYKEYLRYSRDNIEDIKNASFNDHALEETLIQYISSIDQNLTSDFIHRKISQSLKILINKYKHQMNLSNLLGRFLLMGDAQNG